MTMTTVVRQATLTPTIIAIIPLPVIEQTNRLIGWKFCHLFGISHNNEHNVRRLFPFKLTNYEVFQFDIFLI